MYIPSILPEQNTRLTMTSDSGHTIQSTNVRPVLLPFEIPPLTASGALTQAAMVLIDVTLSCGIVGRSYVFAFSESMLVPVAKVVEALSEQVKGDTLAPVSQEAKLLSRLKLLDTPGLVGLALSGLDMAFWDAHSQSMGTSLSRALGSDRRSIPAYNSCGLWIQKVESLADEAESLLADGQFNAIKLRIGRASAKEDIKAVRAVKKRVGDDVHLMVDFNQSQSVNAAIQRARMLDDEGVYWIEEPVRHADYAGTAAVTAATSTPIQTGENLTSHFELMNAISANAANYYMPDVQRIGGVSGWLRASALCNTHGIEMSSHLFPEVSAHLLAATPSCHWLEYVDWANPILETPIEIENGHAILNHRAGNGIRWNEDAVKRYLVRL